MNGKNALVIADVDGSLVTNQKELTPEAIKAVRDLKAAGIRFAITSGRPPLGMKMLVEPLAIDTAISGFNGGVTTKPDLETVIDSHDLSPGDADKAVQFLDKAGVDVWVYNHKSWMVRKLDAPHVKREAWTVKFEPEVVENFTGDRLKDVVKIVGVSDDHALISDIERRAQDEFVGNINAASSQPYYLDFTHAKANKGEVVESLSRSLGIPREHIATVGDMPNDVTMFRKSGMSIAMGNASDAVKAQASCVTDSNEDNGFAKAIDKFILNQSNR